MSLWVVGTDHHRASLDLRVKASMGGKLDELQALKDFSHHVFLSTCNRVEVYSSDPRGPSEFLARWKQEASLTTEEAKIFFSYEGEEALHHLFRVGASLESMVLGENQITGQVKRAYQRALDSSSLSAALHRGFQSSFRVAKRIKAETEISQFSISIPSVGLRLAEKVLGDLSRRVVGVAGLGEIGRLAAEHFAAVFPKRLLLYNRTQETAENLKLQLQSQGVEVEVVRDLDQLLSESDVLVSGMAATALKVEDWQLKLRNSSLQFILDLAVPPQIPPQLSERAFIYFVDDLKRISEENNKLRHQELIKAESIIEDELKRAWSQFEPLDVQQTLHLLSSKVDETRRIELEALRQRLGAVTEEDWKEIEKMSERLSSKILQDPMRELRSRLEGGVEKEGLIQAFRNFFGI
ncbi:MAG: glutamyl-tRNA reductase [Bradymonadales bacterium]|nr:MAG: glutamyl-tRNA reductase [Bradymonadales bacterium]